MRRSGVLALACVVLSGAGAPAHAQTDQDRRIDRLEKEVRELRSILFQGRDTGQPVVVKPAGPDPAVEALQSRADQGDQALQALSGKVEVLGHELDELKASMGSDHDSVVELRGEVKALTDALARTQPAPPEAGGGGLAPPPPSAPGPAAGGAPSAGAADEGSAFRAAKARLEDGDYPSAAGALQAYLQAYPAAAHAREANFDLGEADFGQSLYSEATVAYARALREWPKTAWAPEATVKLARALAASNRNEQACAALGEFRRRYAAGASKTVRTEAASAAVAAKCAAE